MWKKKPSTSQLGALAISVEPHTLDHHLAKDETFSTAYLRAIGAIAAADGMVSLVEYATVNELVEHSDETALASVVLLKALEHPISIRVALEALKTASLGVDNTKRTAAFQAALPLLQLQGFNSHEFMKQLAAALDCPLQKTDLSGLPPENVKISFLNKIAIVSKQFFKGKERQNLASMCHALTNDIIVSQSVIDFENGLISGNELRLRVTEACNVVSQQLDSLSEQLQIAEFAERVTNAYLKTAQDLKQQVKQRMCVAEARINLEKDIFSEDIENTIHDAGNAFELEVSEKLKTDQWKKASVWESIARTTFARELETRIKRVVTRYEKMLTLFREDLRLFQEEMRLTRVSILQQQHHSRLASLMPSLRSVTKVINGVDSAASITLGVSGVAAAGAGAAVYFLGATVVLPVIAPTLPFVAVPVLLAGLFKCLSDSNARKDGEIRYQRTIFEAKLREELLKAQHSFNSQLEQVALDFQQIAIQMIQPIMLEAEASDRLASLELMMTKRLIDHSRKAIVDVMQALPAA